MSWWQTPILTVIDTVLRAMAPEEVCASTDDLARLERIGIFGWSSLAPAVIEELDRYLKPGTVITVQRGFVDFVVTEHGIAKLRGKSVRQRIADHGRGLAAHANVEANVPGRMPARIERADPRRHLVSRLEPFHDRIEFPAQHYRMCRAGV